jgi:hypothetical protein
MPVHPLALAATSASGGFAVLGLSAPSDPSSHESAPCASTRTCNPDDVDAIRTRYALADVCLGVGVVALAAATWLWLTSDRAR